MAFRRIIGLMVVLLVAACQQGVALTVSRSTGNTVSLAVTSLSFNFRACLDSASIYPADQQGHPVWELGRADPHDCVQQVSLGTARPGFSQRSSAPLRPGRAYCAEVNGPGFSTRRGFTVSRSAVVEDGEDVARC